MLAEDEYTLDTDVYDLPISVRCSNCFYGRAATLGDVLKLDPREVKKWKMMGKKTWAEYQKVLTLKVKHPQGMPLEVDCG